ncbi:DUF4256 domain-containing protein [Candidatus Peregrinibacteria bacterium]|nr:DUF4256 domain-containing protein [Candidatus Peregrinibacteria bacterium]
MTQTRAKSEQPALDKATGLDTDEVLSRLVKLGHLDVVAANAVITDLRAKTNSATHLATTPEAHLTPIATPDSQLRPAPTPEHSENQEDPKKLTPEVKEQLLQTLKARFHKNMHRHPEITWEKVEQRLSEAPESKLWSLNEMERTGGEPDVTARDAKTSEIKFEDRSAESPIGRRNCAYDLASEREAIRRDYKPISNAVDFAATMGVNLLNETEYRAAQEVDQLDRNTRNWILTPEKVRNKGLARYGRRLNGYTYIDQRNPNFHDPNRAFRASLKI